MTAEVTQMNAQTIERLQAKTPQQRFIRLLEEEFEFAPKVSQAVLEEVHSNLLVGSDHMRPGQMRTVLTRRQAPHGRRLRELDMVEVIWTVDAGLEDLEVLQQEGGAALRHHRIQRLLSEALEQGGAATQEDLAQVLHVSVRTIKRDFAQLRRRGVSLPTRGYVRGIGRGQTHKAQIISRWLRGETYDQVASHTHHSLASVQRYINTFVQVIRLHRRGFATNEIALLAQVSPYLVREYLAVYERNDSVACRERLGSQLERLNQRFRTAGRVKKGGL
jgi:DNA-binding Lrp family transcriptional regulator